MSDPQLDRDGEYLRFIRDSVRAKADRFGEDTTVGQSLLSDEDRGWSSSGGNVCFRPSERVLKEKGINPAKRSPFVQDQYCFSSYLTWRGVVDTVLTSKKHHSDRTRRSRNTLMVISFRQAVLRNVLWQYEAFGDTSEWHKLSKTAQRELLPKVAPNARWPTYASDALVIIKSGVKGIKAVCVELIKKETPGVTADIGEAWRTPYESLRGKEFIPKGNTDEETKFQEFKMRLEIYAETEELPWLKVKS